VRLSINGNIYISSFNILACTFLGPSRNRGPPKGYIDAIEARIHQAEALLGLMIGSNDQRVRTSLEDLAKVQCN